MTEVIHDREAGTITASIQCGDLNELSSTEYNKLVGVLLTKLASAINSEEFEYDSMTDPKFVDGKLCMTMNIFIP